MVLQPGTATSKFTLLSSWTKQLAFIPNRAIVKTRISVKSRRGLRQLNEVHLGGV